MALKDLATDHAEAVATRIVVKYPMWPEQAKRLIAEIAAAIRSARSSDFQ
jgi:hypothetical protein